MTNEIILDLTPGREYTYSRGGLYQVLCTAREGRTGQQKVVYEGLSGRDAGQIFCCPLSGFAQKFTVVPLPEPPPEPVEPAPPVPPELADMPTWPLKPHQGGVPTWSGV